SSKQFCDDADKVDRTPEQFFETIEYFHHAPDSGLEPLFSVGIPIIHAWIDLRSRQTVSQTDLDRLLDRFAAAAVAGIEGAHLYALWLGVVRWGVKLRLSVLWPNPWRRT